MLTIEQKIKAELPRLEEGVFENIRDVTGWKAKKSRYLAPGSYQDLDGLWTEPKPGEHFGAPDLTVFLENRIVLDAGYKGKKTALHLVIGGEACIFINGIPYNGLDINRSIIPLTNKARGDETFDISIEAYSKDLIMSSRNKFVVDLSISCSRLVAINETIHSYNQDVINYYHFASLCKDDYMRLRVLHGVYQSLLMLDYDAPDLTPSALAASDYLKDAMESYAAQRTPVTMHFTGHSHIDAAWHWPLKETVRKVGRTFSSMLRLMEQYDTFTFAQSMPALYEMAREHYPAIFEQVKKRIKEGRWETVGSMWVEPDANIVSGESFVRQILYGKRYYREVLGSDTNVCFLPDVFGYSPAMPQILKKAGTDYFFTTKLTWNETNEFPYSVFYWKGLDGTMILSGMMSMCTGQGLGLYNGDMSAPGLYLSMAHFKNKDDGSPILYLYGHGDGGGGVTAEMLETLKRLDRIPLMPRISSGSVGEYFAGLDKQKAYPVWDGDLYFEKHRGTYTTAANNKKNNRKSEFLYRDAEILSVMAQLGTGQHISRNLSAGWKKILLNQFHDILPGTCVAEVYEECERDYAEIFALGKELIAESTALLTQKNAPVEGNGSSITVFNTLSWSRKGMVKIDAAGKQVESLDGKPVKQICREGTIEFLAEDVPGMGWRGYRLIDGGQKPPLKTRDAPVVKGRFFDITFNEGGEIVSLYDKTVRREILQAGKKGNVLKLLEDIPVNWYAAWETTRKREDRMPVLLNQGKAELTEDNDLYTEVSLSGVIHRSAITQRILIYKDMPLIAFETTVDWDERNRILRVAFPVDINSSNASYDVAFGNILRPNHLTTSFDEAKFEVCAHKWGDISEGNYGVSLLNDCKYGYSITNSVMELSLLRSADFPSPSRDKGRHSFTYWLYPHQGGIAAAGVAHYGYELNVPLLAAAGPASSAGGALISVTGKSVIVDTLKNAEDGDGIILRVYETYNMTVPVSISFGVSVADCEECNLLEEKIANLPVEHDTISFTVKPFEIRSFRIRFIR
jgi:alpha-mannosidase